MRFKMGHLRRTLTLLLIISGILLVVEVIRMRSLDRKTTLDEIEKGIRTQTSGKSCKHPALPVYSNEMMAFFSEVPPINCNEVVSDWVIVQGSHCVITEEAKRKFGKIYCQFTDIMRVDDYTNRDGETTKSHTKYHLKASDVVKVECMSGTGIRWKSVLTGIRDDPEIHLVRTELRDNVLPVNVLMFGFDSLSHNTFIRKLPKSFKFLTEVLGAQVLNRYNIIGDGTPQALIPILTGQTELELPDTRKRVSDAQYVNIYPFVWNEFAKLGYVTGFLEDLPSTGIFTYRLRGFQATPTNHYMRPYYLAADEKFKASPKLCVGSKPRHQIMLNTIEQFFKSYEDKFKFMFGFHGELSHDSLNLIGAADNDFVEWLQTLHSAGILNNTMLIIFSDHGHRFAKIRDTLQGKQEERLPFFSITLPQWVKNKYPKAYDNLKLNTDRLTSPFDIYPTLKNLLRWGKFEVGDLKERSISLFNQIPEERSCADAYIEPHWCTCLNWEQIPTDTPLTRLLTDQLAQKINDYTSKLRHLCAELRVSQIIWATRLSPNDNMLRFVKSSDYDGFIAELSSKVVLKSQLYQVKVVMAPSNAIYEASITHFTNSSTHISLKDVSRINMYGDQAACILEQHPDLRKYCYCRS